MKFQYRVTTKNPNGNVDSTVHDYDKDALVIGRGGASDIVFQSTQVSLEHARLFMQDDILVVEDMDSFSGVLVNGSSVNRKKLKKGDRLKVGEFDFQVVFENDTWGLHHERDLSKKDKKEDRKTPEDLRVQDSLPSMRTVATLLILCVALPFIGYPILGNNYSSWNGGPISNKHKMIADDCTRCHMEPFKAVRDEQCLSCHALSDHAEGIKNVHAQHSELNFRCGQCHFEHHGDERLIVSAEERCIACHADIKSVDPKSESKNVKNFDQHPDFRVTLQELLDENKPPQTKKVVLNASTKESLVDPTKIKLNHKIHLEKGIKGPDGPENLECSDCHRFTESRLIPEPISFNRDCRRCHNLSFDDRLQNLEVPHGSADAAYNFMYAEYAKLYLASEEERKAQGASNEQFNVRRKPGYKAEKEKSLEAANTFARDVIQADARFSEEVLFTKAACHLCHFVNQDDSVKLEAPKSRFKVAKPNIPNVWMPGAIFDHAAHEEVLCESCHGEVGESTKTSDVMLPDLASCQNCHVGHAEAGNVSSDCTMCHSYHDPLGLPAKDKHSIEDLLARIENSGSNS